MEKFIVKLIHESDHLNACEKWEFFKMEIGHFCKTFSKKEVKAKNHNLENLMKEKKKIGTED